MNRHLTISNLLFVRQFTYQNKGNLFLFLILRYIFNLHLRKRNIAQDSLLGRVLIRDALHFDQTAQGKGKNDDGKNLTLKLENYSDRK